MTQRREVVEVTSMGFKIIGMNYNDHTSPAYRVDGCVHDFIEHQNGIDKIGLLTDEFEALGAIYDTRINWGSSTLATPFRSPEDIFSTDLGHVCSYIHRSKLFASTPTYHQKSDYDEDFRRLMGSIRGFSESEGEKVIGLLNLGAIKSKARFDLRSTGAHDMFHVLYDEMLSVMGKSPEFEDLGSLFEVRWDESKIEAKVKMLDE